MDEEGTLVNDEDEGIVWEGEQEIYNPECGSFEFLT